MHSRRVSAYLLPGGGADERFMACYMIARCIAPRGLQACGSGGTTAGIGLGCHLAGLGLRVHAMAVCDDEEYFYNYVRLLQGMAACTAWVLGAAAAQAVHIRRCTRRGGSHVD